MEIQCINCGCTEFKEDGNIRICKQCGESANICFLQEYWEGVNSPEEAAKRVFKRKSYDVTPERWRDAEDGDWPDLR